MVNWTQHDDPDRRLWFLRHGKNHSSHVPRVLVVSDITVEIREHFGPHFMLIREGGGLYSHKFGKVFASCLPTMPKYQAWWRELAYRADDKHVIFI